jgi:hypothetical protein
MQRIHFMATTRGNEVEASLQKVKMLLRLEDPPEILVLHCGGNNIPMQGSKSIELRFNIIKTFRQISTMLPRTILVWSQILPRGYGGERIIMQP